MVRVLNDQEMKQAWGERFKEKRKEKFATQKQFAEAMQAEQHATTQQTVGRWENIGGRYGKESPGFPDFPTMQSISKLLDVQIGYLIGETDAETFDTEEVMNYLCLSEDAVNALSELTHHEDDDPFAEDYGVERIRVANTLEKLLSSESFIRYVMHLNELDSLLNEFELTYSAQNRLSLSEIGEAAHRKMLLSHGENPDEHIDTDGYFVDEGGQRLYDPDDPERLAEKVLSIRDKTRVMKCLLMDDQMAIVRELWPQVDGYASGVADLGNVVVRADEWHVSVESKQPD